VVLAATYPDLSALNVSRLTSARSALVSAVIFNTVIVVPLLLLAIRAVKAGVQSSRHRFHFSLWIYGLLAFLLSWVGIKLIDAGLTAFRLV
jgi:potassium-transporting ATPase ATP-binding subunit